MCGISAIYTKNNIKDKIFELIKSLQHRGQDSYGFSDGKIVEKYLGMIEKKPLNISGNIALAHTRYTTSKSNNLNLSQPLIKENIVLVHNGHIEKFNSNLKSDSQNLLDYIVENKEKGILETIKNIIKTIDGAYFVILFYNDTVYAFKDKHGIRPGLYGIKDDGDILIASENNSFPDINNDIEPGQIIEIKKGNLKKYDTINSFKPCIFEYLYFLHPNSKVYNLSVREFRTKLANYCKDLIKNNVDVVCGVPNSSRIYGLELARSLKKDYVEPIVKKKRSFILPTQEEREAYVKKKFHFPDYIFNYNHILIVDDSIVRGTTSKHLISLFKEKNCKVTFLSCSPKITNVNKYGINITQKEELVSYKRSHEEIKNYLNCDYLVYQNIENLFKASGFKNLELSIYEN